MTECHFKCPKGCGWIYINAVGPCPISGVDYCNFCDLPGYDEDYWAKNVPKKEPE